YPKSVTIGPLCVFSACYRHRKEPCSVSHESLIGTDMLKLQLKDKRDEPILVEEKLYSIGSASDNNLVLTDPSIDPIHARLISGENGKVFIKDNTSANGSFVNGE